MNLLESLIPADFRRSISPVLRRYFLGIFVNFFAIGLTLALYVIYLHNVHGFSTSFATLLLAASAVAGLAAIPLWGPMTDLLVPSKSSLSSVSPRRAP